MNIMSVCLSYVYKCVRFCFRLHINLSFKISNVLIEKDEITESKVDIRV